MILGKETTIYFSEATIEDLKKLQGMYRYVALSGIKQIGDTGSNGEIFFSGEIVFDSFRSGEKEIDFLKDCARADALREISRMIKKGGR